MSKFNFFKTNIICLIIFIGFQGYSQSTSLLRLETTYFPENDAGVETTRYRFLVNVPFKLNEDDYFVSGVELNRYDYDAPESLPFNTSELDRLYVLDLNLGYITKWNENWSFIGLVNPRLASNFTGGISIDDFRLNLTAALLKDVKDVDKPYRIALGLSFNSSAGLPFPLPIINYYKRFHPKWSYTLGVPRMNFKYHATKKHTLQMALFLDGYFVNIKNDIIFPNGDLGSNISSSALIGAFGYQYNITKLASFYGLVGHTIAQNGVLRDDSRNEVFVLNNQGNLYIRGGFKISIF